MKNTYWVGVIALFVLGSASGASFDCTRASTQIEKTICADKQLSEIDETMSAIYKKALSNASDTQVIKSRQRSWLTGERDKCQDAPCLLSAYKKRLAELSNLTDKAATNETSIVGKIDCGQQTCSIVAENGSSLMFELNSSVGKKILQLCKVDDVCEITGRVENEDVLTTISNVKKRMDGQQASSKIQQVSQGNGTSPQVAATRSPEEEKEAALRQHWNDALTIDYALTTKGIGGIQKKDRPAAGTLRKITLGQYLNWERNTKSEWQFKLWNAMGIQNKNAVYNQCLQEVEQQWIRAFGYRETVLRSPIFVKEIVDLEKALRIVCAPS